MIPDEYRDSVSFVGRVPSLDVWTSDAWAVVVPVVGGVGAPVKFLEALATRAPVLSTTDGAPMARDAATLVSDASDAWAAALRRLLAASGPPADSPISLDAISWEASSAPLLAWLADLSGPRRRPV